MRGLLKIVAGGFVAFMLLAIAQEWESFSRAWSSRAEAVPAMTDDERAAATRALELFVRVGSHYYASGGDPRFAERLPASEGVVAELTAEIEYLRKNRRLQDPRLARLEVVRAERVDGGRIELRTREWWYVRTISLADRRDSDRPLALRWTGRYLLAPVARGWRVEGWGPAEEEPEPPAPSGGAGAGAPS